MLENVGSLFSLSNVTNYLKSAKRSASNDTIYDYIAAISGALLLQEVQRYNIAGKQILSNVCKHYASDLGIMQIKAAKNKINEGALLENLVYNELIRRQYDVYVGYLEAGEVDFVAIKGGEPTYIQVTTYLSDPKVQQREFGSLLKIMDNWEKLVISKDRTDFSQDGIKHKNIVDWLLEQ
jgi:predicted AAA+ superfamily ATPase